MLPPATLNPPSIRRTGKLLYTIYVPKIQLFDVSSCAPARSARHLAAPAMSKMAECAKQACYGTAGAQRGRLNGNEGSEACSCTWHACVQVWFQPESIANVG